MGEGFVPAAGQIVNLARITLRQYYRYRATVSTGAPGPLEGLSTALIERQTLSFVGGKLWFSAGSDTCFWNSSREAQPYVITTPGR